MGAYKHVFESIFNGKKRLVEITKGKKGATILWLYVDRSDPTASKRKIMIDNNCDGELEERVLNSQEGLTIPECWKQEP